jgi:hypothetical protein
MRTQRNNASGNANVDGLKRKLFGGALAKLLNDLPRSVGGVVAMRIRCIP